MNRLTVQEVALAAQAALVMLEAHYRLRRTSVDEMRRWATVETGAPSRVDTRDQLLLAFRRAANRLGGTCLVRALALQRFLARRGHPSELRIGVARTARGFEAHAWLVDGEDILEGGGQEAEEFTLLAAWPSGRVSS